MTNRLYVRTTLTIPGAGTAIHVAQLSEIDASTCRMDRLIALTPDHAIAGAASENAVERNIDKPNRRVPHPDSYDNFENIEAEYVSEGDFEALWAEAQAKFPSL